MEGKEEIVYLTWLLCELPGLSGAFNTVKNGNSVTAQPLVIDFTSWDNLLKMVPPKVPAFFSMLVQPKVHKDTFQGKLATRIPVSCYDRPNNQ